MVKSAGNNGGDLTYPGTYSSDIFVIGNIDEEGYPAGNASYGENMLAVAPGVHILSTTPNNEVGYMSGSSMACPHVAGIAALILERNPSLLPSEVKAIIAQNTIADRKIWTDISVGEYGLWDPVYGYGLVNAYKAIINTPGYHH